MSRNASIAFLPSSQIGGGGIRVAGSGGGGPPPIPAVYSVIDTMDGPDGPIAGRTPDYESAGFPWQTFRGTSANQVISGNNAVFSSSGTPETATVNCRSGDGKMLVYARFQGTASFDIVLRASDANNLWQLTVTASGCFLYKIVAGAATLVTSSADPFTPDTLYGFLIELEGSDIRCTLDTNRHLNTTDSFNAAASYHGVGAYSASSGSATVEFFRFTSKQNFITGLHGVNITHSPDVPIDFWWGRLWGYGQDWATQAKPWITRQIDLVAANGGNAIRIISTAYTVTGGLMSQATYNGRLAEIIDYAAAKGLYYYAVLDSGIDNTGVSVEPTMAERLTYMTSVIGVLNTKPNVLGIDCWQEWDGLGMWTEGHPEYCQEIYNTLKPLTQIPLTFSTVDLNVSSADYANNSALIAQINPFTDYYDGHLYANPVSPDGFYWFRVEFRNIIIGEHGRNDDGSFGTQYADIKAIIETSNIKNALAWAAADQGPAEDNQYGLWDNTGAAKPNKAIWETFPAGPPYA